MTEKEQQAIDKMIEERTKLQVSTFDYMKSVLRWDAHELEISGYKGKTQAEAIKMILARAVEQIEKSVKAHIKQYPDSK